MKIILIIITILFSFNAFAGELDGKGLVCGPVGYFFDNNKHTYFEFRNGDIVRIDMGKYRTSAHKIFVKTRFGTTRAIERDDPKLVHDNTWYVCKIAIGYPSFIEMLKSNLENIKNNNKI